MKRDVTEIERAEWWRKVRDASRTAYAELLNVEQEVAAAFGDAFTFYKMIGLPWRTARGLAMAGYFYPNEVIDAPDSELMKAKEVGPSGLKKIRAEMDEKLAVSLSTSDLMDEVTGDALRPKHALPHCSEMDA